MRDASIFEAGEQYIVSLRIGSRVFAPSWWAIALTIVLFMVFLRLGFWQLARAEEKRVLAVAAQQGRQSMVDYTAQQADSLPRYQQVRIQGRYDPEHQLLLDNMPSAQGQPGYRVWTPFITTQGELLIVDRGWIPLGASRQQRPSVAVADTPRTLVGVLDDLPRPGTRVGDAGLVNQTWPQVVNYPRHDELVAVYGPHLGKRIVLLNADQEAGYQRLWQMDVGFTPERHVAYAVQWFAFAITLLVVFVVVNLRGSIAPDSLKNSQP